MAQALEKLFLTKVAQMPQEEIELAPPVKPGMGDDISGPGRKGRKGRVPGRGISANSSKSLCLLVHSFSLIVFYTLTGKKLSLNFGLDNDSTLKSVEVIEIATPWFNPNLPEMSGMS